jgi:hypothetical protein
VSLSAESTIPVPVGDEQDRDHLRLIDRSQTLTLLGLAIVLASVAVCVLAARRRSVAIAGLGVGALVTAGTLAVAVSVVTPRAIDGIDGSTRFGRSLQKLLLDRASDSFDDWLMPIAVAGAVALVVGVAGRALTGRRD